MAERPPGDRRGDERGYGRASDRRDAPGERGPQMLDEFGRAVPTRKVAGGAPKRPLHAERNGPVADGGPAAKRARTHEEASASAKAATEAEACGDAKAESGRAGPAPQEPAPDEAAATPNVDDEEARIIAQVMGFSGFASTHGRHVDDPQTNLSGMRLQTKRTARQFMNRRGGFNRPLPAEKTGERVKRD